MDPSVRRVSHEEAQTMVEQLTKKAKTLNAETKQAYYQTLTSYQEQLKVDMEAPNPEQAQRIEELEQQVLRLQQEATENSRKRKVVADMAGNCAVAAKKTKLLQAKMEGYQRVAMKVASLPHYQVEDELKETKNALEEIEVFKAILAHKVALLEVKRQETLAFQELLQRQTNEDSQCLQQEARESICKDGLDVVQQQIKETKGQELNKEVTAQRIERLLLKLEGYQTVAMEVASLSYDEVETQLEKEQDALEAMEKDVAILVHQIALLEAKQKEHLAIRERLQKELQGLVALVPKTVSEDEVCDYLKEGVQAIVKAQEALVETHGDRAKHPMIGALLESMHHDQQKLCKIFNRIIKDNNVNCREVSPGHRCYQIITYIHGLEFKKSQKRNKGG